MAETVFAASGILVLTVGLILGIPMAAVRMKTANAPRYLVAAHLEALIGGAILMSLSAAVRVVTLPESAKIACAYCLAGGVTLSLVGGAANWLAGSSDAFAERPKGWYLQALGGILMVLSGLTLSLGVVTTLL